MANGLIEAETNYIGVLGRKDVNIGQALKMNLVYHERLFDFYEETMKRKDKDKPEYEHELSELEYELEHLLKQAHLLRNIQLNNMGGTF
jgi:hypothetical protein